MKFMETHFDEYISSSKKNNLHPNLITIFDNFPKNIYNLSNLIFYGAKGIGKYTQMLRLISKYSPTELKYEKKICINFNKSNYFFKISDIHYEVDMSLLGCNSKLLWHAIYLHIIDIISTKQDRVGIIVCKFFKQIHNELLDNFYSYMQKNYSSGVELKFIIITTDISFIPENIINCCKIIPIARPSISTYKKCFKQYNQKLISNDISKENISNIKSLSINNTNIMTPYKIICNKIIDNIINYERICYYKFRDLLYDVFIYDIDVGDCIWYIFEMLIKKQILKKDKLAVVLKKTYEFFKYYNNNYRPIYHMENYFLTIIKIIYDL